jgi:hypothetical protein
MTPERWKEIKAMKPAAPRYIHISKECDMRKVTSPNGVESLVPWYGKGVTYRK